MGLKRKPLEGCYEGSVFDTRRRQGMGKIHASLRGAEEERATAFLHLKGREH